ncbi:MAG: GyrI-like domain-containing protein [Candidatus Saccharibacteria bacterium]
MSDVLKGAPEILDIPAMPVRSRRVMMTDFPMGLPALMGGIFSEIQAAGKMPAGAPILLYHDENYDPKNVDVECAWPVDDPALATGTLPAVRAMRYVHVGPYTTLEPVYNALMGWVTENGYKTLCPMREVYPNDPSVTPPEELITEIIFPVENV